MIKSQRQDQKDQTRKCIVEAALQQFAKDGLTAAKTSDIAMAAKVSHGTIFVHFPTRENLLDTVIEEFGMRISRRLHELADKNCSMEEVLKAHLKGVAEYESFYTRLVTENRLLSESSRNTLIIIQSSISFHILQIAEKEMKAGVLRSIPYDLLFNTWIGLVHHYLANGDLFAPGVSVVEQHGNRLVDYFINLIALK